MTRAMERPSVISTSRTDARMVVVRSRTTVKRMAGGISACNCGIRARTRSTVSMMLAPGCRNTTTEHGGLAVGQAGGANILDRIGDRGDVESLTGAPLLVGRSPGAGIRRPGEADPSCSTPTCGSRWSGRPLGRLALAAPSTVRTSSRLRPRLFEHARD